RTAVPGGHPGKAVGQWLPDIALAFFTAGVGTAADGGIEAARDLSRVEKAAEAAGAAESEGGLVEGAGTGTRAINFRPNATDPNWGLTEAHLDKHLYGSAPLSLSEIDPAGNPDLWRDYIQDLAG